MDVSQNGDATIYANFMGKNGDEPWDWFENFP